MVTGKVRNTSAIPIVDIITLAATGSEYDCGGVISRTETNDKLAYFSPYVFPVASFIDPTYTFTLPPNPAFRQREREESVCGKWKQSEDCLSEAPKMGKMSKPREFLDKPSGRAERKRGTSAFKNRLKDIYVRFIFDLCPILNQTGKSVLNPNKNDFNDIFMDRRFAPRIYDKSIVNLL